MDFFMETLFGFVHILYLVEKIIPEACEGRDLLIGAVDVGMEKMTDLSSFLGLVSSASDISTEMWLSGGLAKYTVHARFSFTPSDYVSSMVAGLVLISVESLPEHGFCVTLGV
jgi:hypothetical protein